MATGDDADAPKLPFGAAAAPTRGMSETTLASRWTATSSGVEAAPPGVDDDEPTLREGETVGRYRIDGVLGRGGMGVVYLARDPDLDRGLAIKLVRSLHRGGDRMLREAQAMARLDHPNVVPIYDVGLREQQVFFVMPLLSGGTLGAWCRQEARPWREVLRRYIDAGRGLEAAHRAGIVHRDFKPDNVLLTAKGDVQVADFGIARASWDERADEPALAAATGRLGQPLTRAGQVLGTPAYMAPEQLDGKAVDAKADQFSFCVALHEGLYGVRPFELRADDGLPQLREALAAERIREPAPSRDVPSWLRAILMRGLRYDPSARWASMAALLEALERRTSDKRSRSRLAVTGLAAVAVTTAIIAIATRNGSTPASSASAPPSPSTRAETFTPRQLTFRGDLEAGKLAPDDSAVIARAGDSLLVVPLRPGAEPTTLQKGARDIVSFAWSPDASHVMTVTPIVDGRSMVRMIEIASGTSEQRELPVYAVATLIGERDIASTLSDMKSVQFTSIDSSAAPTQCPLPGDYLWMKSLHAEAGALFVTVQHADDSFSVFRTDRLCTTPRLVIDHERGRAIVTVDHDGTHVGILRDVFGALVLDRHPVDGGPATRSPPLPFDAASVAGRTTSGSVVLIRTEASWSLVRIEGDPAQVTDVLGSGSSEVELEVAPDGNRVARRGMRRQMETSVVPIDQLDAIPEPIAPTMHDFAWSPDGSRLAGFLGSGVTADVVIAPAAGGLLEHVRLPQPATGHFVWIDDHHLAFLRNDNRTFVSLDLRTSKTADLFDPGLGWTFELAINRVDGSLALYWNRRDGAGVYIARPGQTPERITAKGDAVRFPAWSNDGRSLWMYEFRGSAIDRYDLVTRKLTRVFDLTDPTTTITHIWPQIGDQLVVKIARGNNDLVVYE